MRDERGISHLWVAPTDRRSSPQMLSSKENQDSPFYLPNGELIYRCSEGTLNFICTRGEDGSGEKKVSDQPILELQSVSPDGKWALLVVTAPNKDEPGAQVVAYRLEDGTRVEICSDFCLGGWDLSGKDFIMIAQAKGESESYFLPVVEGKGLPKLPEGGFKKSDELRGSAKVKVVGTPMDSAISPEVYSYTRENVRRNLYRIPVP